jgi:hypothetical protein
MEIHGNEVTVVDIKMPFWSMVVFMVKWSIAAIPALLILVVLGMILAGFLGGLTAGLGR